MDEQAYIEAREAEAFEAWKVQVLADDPNANVEQETYADEQLAAWEAIYDPEW